MSCHSFEQWNTGMISFGVFLFAALWQENKPFGIKFAIANSLQCRRFALDSNKAITSSFDRSSKRGKLVRSITAVTLFLFTVLGATASHATYTWTTLDHPSATHGTTLFGIDGANMVGHYEDSSGIHGTLYDGSTWTPLDHPGASSTTLNGIDGTNMVGFYSDSGGTHGTLYDGSTWTTLDHPSATSTYLHGIDGANMVGYYTDSSGNNHGFMVTATSPVPEPAAILLALFGLALLPRRRRRSGV